MAATYDWPNALRPASVEWGLIVPQRMGRSVFDGSVQAQTLGAPRWTFTITLGPMKLAEVSQWEAFFQSLRGMVNRARVWDWRRETPLGTLGGSPTVRGPYAGNVIDSENWTPGSVILAGTYIGVSGELKRLSYDAGVDGAGRSLLTFEPPLRAAATVGSAIVLIKPPALFVMTTDRPTLRQEGARSMGGTFTFEEVFA